MSDEPTPMHPSAGEDESRTLWHGRFADGPDAALLALSESLSFDRRLAADDVTVPADTSRCSSRWAC